MATSSRLSGVRLSSTTPRRRLATVALSAKPKGVSCRTGGRISDMTRRRSRRIWANSLARSARIRRVNTVRSGTACASTRSGPEPHASQLSAPDLHAAHGQPGERVEDGADDPDDRDVKPDGRPPAALQQGVPDHLDVVAAP